MESSGRALVCSVLFLGIDELSEEPSAARQPRKHELHQALERALQHVAARDRLVLETDDGAAIAFLGDPEDALLAAAAMRDAGGVPLRLGLHLGPVRLVADPAGQLTVGGEGIEAASRVMRCARRGELCASRPFYEVASCLSRDYAQLFQPAEARGDAQLPEVYPVARGRLPGRSRRPGDARHEDTGWLSRSGPLGVRRSALIAALAALCVGAAGGVGGRALLGEPHAKQKQAAKKHAAPSAR